MGCPAAIVGVRDRACERRCDDCGGGVMIFGRLLGWVLMALAVVMASADAVMALSPAEYAGIATADVVTLLTGGTPRASGIALLPTVETMLLHLPAWVVIGVMGTSLLLACRKRHRRWRFKR